MNKMKKTLSLICLIISLNTHAQTLLIAHRGASNLAPENTLAAAKLGWELGADAVEVDIHMSLDNRVMAIHDKTTNRTCLGKNFTIAKAPSMLLRDLDAGSKFGSEFKGEKIPFLEELIQAIPENKKLVVEIKCDKEVVHQLIRIVGNSNKQEQLVFIAFDFKTIVATKEAFPDNECYWLSESKSAVKKNIHKVKQAKLDGINLSYKIIDQEIVELAKENNLRVLSWTIDDPKEAQRLIELGVEAITTNRPKWLKDELSLN